MKKLKQKKQLSLKRNSRRGLSPFVLGLSLLFVGACRTPEGKLDQSLGDLRSGKRAPLIDPHVRGLSVALCPDPGSQFGTDADQLQTLAVREADLKDVLLTFFNDSDMNLLLDPEISGPSTFEFKNTTISDAFISVLEANGLGFQHDGDFVKISKTETRMYQLNFLSGGGSNTSGGAVSGTAQAGSSPAWSTVRQNLQSLATSPNAKILIDESAGTIAVTEQTGNLQKIENYLEVTQERYGRQVMIEARLFEVALSDIYLTGVDYSLLPGFFDSGNAPLIDDPRISGNPDTILRSNTNIDTGTSAAGLKLGYVRSDKYSLVMSALQSQGQVRILSAPRVATLNNVPAQIRLTEQIPQIQVQVTTTTTGAVTTSTISFVEAGITINVNPQISDNGEIWADISPSITEVSRTVIAPGGAQSPQLNTRSTSARLHVPNGQSIILGGIRAVRKNESDEGIPVLMDIPFLGALFRSTKHEKSETELVIMMTPSIIRSETLPDLVRDGLSRVERLTYPYTMNTMNLNNNEDQHFGIPKADQSHVIYESKPTPMDKMDKTVTRRGLAKLFLLKGIKSYRDHRLFEATAFFNKSLLFHALGGEANNYLGLIALQSGDREKAKRYFEERIAANPSDSIAMNNRGILELLDGHPLVAEPYLKKAVELLPKSANAQNNLGLVYALLDQKEAAQKAFGDALDLDTENPEAHFNLARIYDSLSFGRAAIPHYQAFLNALPRSAQPQSQYAAERLLKLREEVKESN